MLLDDARVAFRFAVVAYKRDYRFGLPLKRNNVGQWWVRFRRKLVSDHVYPAPNSIWSMCRDNFLRPFKILNELADQVAAQQQIQLREEIELRQRAKENLDTVMRAMEECPGVSNAISNALGVSLMFFH